MQEVEIKSDLLLDENSYIKFMKSLKLAKNKNQISDDHPVYIWIDSTELYDYLMKVQTISCLWKWKIDGFYDDGSYFVEIVTLKNLLQHIRPYVPSRLL